ncbi:MAG: hypothetical protein RRA35_08545, partial [Desulfomonilia bacterium]|nr:hypothetical protein [Desulfomonilia bacterium]
MKQSYVPFILACVLLLLVSGCGSGSSGSSGDTNQQAVPVLSVAAAYPGSFITISHDSIKEGVPSIVVFSDGQNYEVSFSVESTTDGSARIAVPLYIDPDTGEIASADVTVSINGQAVSGTFLINAFPAIGNDGGEVFVMFLEKMIASYENAQDDLLTTTTEEEIDLTSLVDDFHDRIAALQASIQQVETTGTLTLATGEGAVVLNRSDLRFLDQWLASLVLGMDAELSGPTAASGQGIDMSNWGEISANERLQRIRSSIDNVIDEFERGLEGGKVWIGGVTVGFAVAGALVGGPVGAAVGAAAGLALAYFSAGYELGSAAAFERICDSFSQKSREGYDWGRGLVNQAVRIATNAAAGIGDKIGSLFSWISTAITVGDTMDAAENVRCKPDGGSFMVAPRAMGAFTIQDFCGDDYVIPTDSMTAVVTISGSEPYSRSFSPAHVFTTFSSISDGITDIMVGIPTIVGSDLASTSDAIWEGDVLAIMFNHEEIQGPYPSQITVTDDWLNEGGLVEISFSTPSIRNHTPYNDPVLFSAISGTVTLVA